MEIDSDTVAMLREEPQRRPPSRLLLLLEGRAFAEYAQLRLSWRSLQQLPRGDGHPVLVIPGFATTDGSTRPLRRVLKQLGYDVHGWGQGRNYGMRGSIREALRMRIDTLYGEGRKISLVGWSLGGVYAREIARHDPSRVRRVITLGSPINGHPQSNNVDRIYRWANRGRAQPVDWEGHQRRRVAPAVPCTAIYSKSDGIVDWRCSLEEIAPNTENVEVRGSHCGLGVNPQVVRIIADRLARPLS
ncbi:MAG TPA: alpha/beta hydrolase [Verrucomicrobiae bacterium]|nr:alpha/beta hydrolase [Verrucomicrobiae bacterium]